MLPTLVIVGRPNVGKSTLFNRITKSRDAIVFNQPGLTRDRHYGRAYYGHLPFLVVDTGGFEPIAKDGILKEMAKQTELAIAEADVIVFVTDGREGLTGQDQDIANRLRRAKATVFLAVNKTEGMPSERVTAEFHELGLGEPYAISGSHGEGVRRLVAATMAPWAPPEPKPRGDDDEAEEAEAEPPPLTVEDTLEGGQAEFIPPVDPDFERHGPRIAIVGRPNVGKSTLVNKLAGVERVIAFDEPGTTRDAIEVPIEWHDKPYTLIDTAGLRKQGKVFEAVEKFSVVKTLQAVEACNVVILLLDGRTEISEQDAHIAGFIIESGRSLVVAINKWDNLDQETRERIKREFAFKLSFLEFAEMHYISAKDGMALTPLFDSVDKAYQSAMVKLPTPKLTRALETALARHQPPLVGLHRPKMRFAHQGGSNPPTVIVHGTHLTGLAEAYRRFLEKSFRLVFKLTGTPLRVQFKSSANPFAGRPKPVPSKREEDQQRRARIRNKRQWGR